MQADRLEVAKLVASKERHIEREEQERETIINEHNALIAALNRSHALLLEANQRKIDVLRQQATMLQEGGYTGLADPSSQPVSSLGSSDDEFFGASSASGHSPNRASRSASPDPMSRAQGHMRSDEAAESSSRPAPEIPINPPGFENRLSKEPEADMRPGSSAVEKVAAADNLARSPSTPPKPLGSKSRARPSRGPQQVYVPPRARGSPSTVTKLQELEKAQGDADAAPPTHRDAEQANGVVAKDRLSSHQQAGSRGTLAGEEEGKDLATEAEATGSENDGALAPVKAIVRQRVEFGDKPNGALVRKALQARQQEVNAFMDRLVPKDGTPLGPPPSDSQTSAPPTSGSANPMPETRAGGAREWDAHKSEDPQQDLFKEGQDFPRPTMGSWADDEPHTPAHEEGNGASEASDAVSGRQSQGRFEDQFPGLYTGKAWASPQKPDWDNNDAFPSLGGGPAGGGPQGAQGPWGARNSIKDRLTDGSVFTRLGTTARPAENIEDFERRAGLRAPDDLSTDSERIRQMMSKRDFEFFERVRGRQVNTMEGLELHFPVLSDAEQGLMERHICHWLDQGFMNQLKGRTFSAPRKWARGKGRMTVQFGCCYNYATDKQQRPPGILSEEVVEDMPPVLVALAQRLVRWKILPRAMEPDSAIVNIYEVDDCIPPHIDHHDFARPFCTISLLSEECILFGATLQPLDQVEHPGVFVGKESNGCGEMPLPVGSCLVLKGNGADLARHCVPPVKHRRMSITLRKMGESHAARVKAERAKQNAGLRNIVHPPPSVEAEEGAPPPARSQVNLSDLVVDKRSRAAAAKDARPGSRWEAEGSVSKDRW